MRTSTILERLIDRIERAESLDRTADGIAGLVRKAIRPGPIEDGLSGVPVGHPLHPLLVTVPIGSWVSAAVLDATGDADGARRLTALGVLSALPTAATGASDWLSTKGAEKRVGLVHALANDAALTAYAVSWWARARGHRNVGIAASAVGAAALGTAGWLGGHLAYAQGVGVDTTAFVRLPAEWTDVGATDEFSAGGAPSVADAGGAAVLVVWRNGGWAAFAARCTHRGGPLHEGDVADGCITCPWHGSRFSLDDGTVASGPATRPQPVLETRVVDGRLQVRRDEPRTLRTNPVRS